jgi:predicted acylesterase/phospholipase RssA
MPTENTPDIRHLVLSGGGIWGFKTYGALREASKQQFLDMSKIESIYCTSVGTMIAVVLAMKFDFQIIDDYLIKRPWQNVYGVNMTQIFNIYQTRGIYNENFICEYLSPFLKACDFSLDITMAEFFEKTAIEIHIYVTEINAFECIDISYKTHPEWKIVDAVYASCSLPIVFSPIINGEKCYLDGSFLMNYPLIKCIDSVGIDQKDSILAIFLNSEIDSTTEKMKITETSNFFDYMMVLVNRFLQSRLFINDLTYKIPYECCIYSPEFTLEYIDYFLKSSDERRTIIEKGAQNMREWLEKINNKEDVKN